ncbi:MAG TPA: sulfotransferase [Leptolyngbyaceae cyanobacterium]
MIDSDRFSQPVFIVSSPRSGSSFLFETLVRSKNVWTIGEESHEAIEGIAKLHPAQRNYDSNRLTERDADRETAALLRERFWELLRDRNGQPVLPDAKTVRMLEKTPKNSLRIPFLSKVFPEALFIYLYREPQEVISSIMEAWRSGQFVTYPELPNWDGMTWSLLLFPGWQELRGKPLAEIAAQQWAKANQYILEDLAYLPAERWCCVTYQDLIANLPGEVKRLCEFAGWEWDLDFSEPFPLSRHTLTPPAPDKWKKNAAEIEAVLPQVAEIVSKAKDAIALRLLSRN